MSRSFRFALSLIAAWTLTLVACGEPVSPSPERDQLNGASLQLAATPITTCGTVISVSGTYTLAQDLTGCPGHGIEIFASNVVLFLNGHTISGTPTSAYGINVGAARRFHGGVSGVTIQGPGFVEFFFAGISFEEVSFSKVQDITSRFNLFGLAFNRSHASGDLLPSHHDSIIGNAFINNRAHGVTINGGAKSVFYANKSGENGLNQFGNGFYLYDAERITLDRNQALRNGTSGVRIESLSRVNTIVNNIATGNQVEDLTDDNPACDRNAWSGNTFGTASQACIQ